MNTQPTSIDETIKELFGSFLSSGEATTKRFSVGELREKLTTLVEQARQEVAKEVAMAGENKISLLNDDNFTGTYWISLNSLYFHLTGRHINADWENGVIEKNASIEAFLRENAARTISSDSKNV